MCSFEEYWLNLGCPAVVSFVILDCACSFKTADIGIFLHTVEAWRKEVLLSVWLLYCRGQNIANDLQTTVRVLSLLYENILLVRSNGLFLWGRILSDHILLFQHFEVNLFSL